MHKTITGLIPDTPYGVQVRAVNSNNISEWSTRFDFETTSVGTNPDAVTNVTITVISDSFHIEWDRMANNPNNANSPIIRYEMELFGNDYEHDGYPSFLQGSSTRLEWNMSFSDNVALFNGVPRATVKVRIRAVDANGLAGAWSSQQETTNPPPGPVENLTAVGITNGVSLAWTQPVDDDLIGYRVYGETTDNTFLPDSLNLLTETPSLSFYFQTDVDTMWFFVVVAVDKFGSESTTLERAQADPESIFEFDTVAPPVPDNIAGTISTEDFTLYTIIHVTWEYATPPDDLSGFQIRYRPVGDTLWNTETIPATWDDVPLEWFIEGLEPYVDYEIGMRAYDFVANFSAWTLNETVPAANNLVPSQPSDPTAAGNNMHIQVVHNGLNFEGYPLEEDVAFLEVYANTTNTPMSWPTDSDYVLGTIAFGPGMVQTFNIPASAASGSSQQWYVSVLAVDRAGLRSDMSDLVPVTVGLIDTLNVSDAAITNAKIFSLEVNKLTAGTGVINDLTVKSTLTMGDALDAGYIKSYDWVAGTSGWRIGKNYFEVNDGTISAGALSIQDSAQNLMPLAYSDFQWLDYYYINNAIHWRGQNGLYLSAGVADSEALNSVFNNRHLKIYSTSNAQSITARFTTQAAGANGYNIDVEEGAQYIVSGYMKNTSASSCTWKLQVIGDVSGTPTTLVDQSNVMSASETSYTRYQTYFTVPSGCNRVVVGVANSQTDRPKELRLDGFQFERVISSETTASPWRPPGSTTIEGGGITTGFLRSSSNIDVNGTDQPLWSIDLNGIAQFGDARIRGRLLVGSDPGTESDSYISSGNYTSTVGWKIDGVGDADFASITSRHSSGSTMVIGTVTDPYSVSSTGIHIYPPSGSTLTKPAQFKTRWYTHTDFGEGAQVQINAPLQDDFATNPAHIYLGSFESTSTTDIDMFATHFWLKSIQFKFSDNSGNRVEFKHSPTVGGYDDGFAFVGASGKKIVFDFNASNNKIQSKDGSNALQRLFIDSEYMLLYADDITAGPQELHVGPAGGDRLMLHGGNASASNAVGLYYGLDGGGLGMIKTTNWGATVNRRIESLEFVVTSDISMKKNAKATTGALDSIKKLKVYDYDFNVGDGPTSQAKGKDLVPGRGVVAQELKEVIPDAVIADDAGILGVGLYALLATTVAAVQELTSRLEKLEAK